MQCLKIGRTNLSKSAWLFTVMILGISFSSIAQDRSYIEDQMKNIDNPLEYQKRQREELDRQREEILNPILDRVGMNGSSEASTSEDFTLNLGQVSPSIVPSNSQIIKWEGGCDKEDAQSIYLKNIPPLL